MTSSTTRRPAPTPRRWRRRAAAAGLALAMAALAGCSGRYDFNGDLKRPNTFPTPGLQTLLPTENQTNNVVVTISPYPSATASPERGDNVGTHG